MNIQKIIFAMTVVFLTNCGLNKSSDCGKCMETILFSDNKICIELKDTVFVGGFVPTMSESFRLYHLYQATQHDCKLVNTYKCRITGLAFLDNSNFSFNNEEFLISFTTVEGSILNTSIPLVESRLQQLENEVAKFQEKHRNEILKYAMSDEEYISKKQN